MKCETLSNDKSWTITIPACNGRLDRQVHQEWRGQDHQPEQQKRAQSLDYDLLANNG